MPLECGRIPWRLNPLRLAFGRPRPRLTRRRNLPKHLRKKPRNPPCWANQPQLRLQLSPLRIRRRLDQPRPPSLPLSRIHPAFHRKPRQLRASRPVPPRQASRVKALRVKPPPLPVSQGSRVRASRADSANANAPLPAPPKPPPKPPSLSRCAGVSSSRAPRRKPRQCRVRRERLSPPPQQALAVRLPQVESVVLAELERRVFRGSRPHCVRVSKRRRVRGLHRRQSARTG